MCRALPSWYFPGHRIGCSLSPWRLHRMWVRNREWWSIILVALVNCSAVASTLKRSGFSSQGALLFPWWILLFSYWCAWMDMVKCRRWMQTRSWCASVKVKHCFFAGLYASFASIVAVRLIFFSARYFSIYSSWIGDFLLFAHVHISSAFLYLLYTFLLSVYFFHFL